MCIHISLIIFKKILNYFIIAQLQLSAFSPNLSIPPEPNPPPPPLLPPSPLVLSMCPIQQFLKTLLPTIPSPLTSRYCQISLTIILREMILLHKSKAPRTVKNTSTSQGLLFCCIPEHATLRWRFLLISEEFGLVVLMWGLINSYFLSVPQVILMHVVVGLY